MTHSTQGIPDEPTGVTSLKDLTADLLAQAREHHSRRAAKTIVAGTLLRTTALALGEGADLAEHDSPPAATLHVVTGRVRLHTAERQWTLDAGDIVAIPPERHGLHALTDALVLLTVALG